MVCACAWVCVIVERAAVPSEVLRLMATPSERATVPAGRALRFSAISPIRPTCAFPAPAQHARDSPSGPVFKNTKTAAPREGVRVTRADFVHLIRLVAHSERGSDYATHISHTHTSQCGVRKSCRLSAATRATGEYTEQINVVTTVGSSRVQRLAIAPTDLPG